MHRAHTQTDSGGDRVKSECPRTDHCRGSDGDTIRFFYCRQMQVDATIGSARRMGAGGYSANSYYSGGSSFGIKPWRSP